MLYSFSIAPFTFLSSVFYIFSEFPLLRIAIKEKRRYNKGKNY